MKYKPGEYIGYHLILSFDYKDKNGNRYHTLQCGNCNKTFQAIPARIFKEDSKYCTHCYHDANNLPNRDDPAWISWARMLQRVRGTGPQSANKNYKDRGITVCDTWLSFDAFFADMGPRPPGTSLDRIDVDGNYNKENCRWATRKEQANNTRVTVRVTWKGETRTLSEWSEHMRIPLSTLATAWKLGKEAGVVRRLDMGPGRLRRTKQ